MTEAFFKQRDRMDQARQERRELLLQIPYDYADFLENAPRGHLVSTRLLPHPKEEIARAILFSIANAKEKREIQILSNLLPTLAMAQDIGEHDTLTPPTIDDFENDPQRFKAAWGNYSAISRKLQESIERDLAFYRVWTERAMAVNEHMWSPLKRWWERLRSNEPVPRQIPADWVDFPD